MIAQTNSLLMAPSEGFSSGSAGTTLEIPNVDLTLQSKSNNFTPYNPLDTIGNTTPSPIAPPPPKCNVVKTIVVAVVAAVVTVYTAGLLGPATAGSVFGSGLGVLGGGAFGAGVGGYAATAAVGFVAGFTGNIASQAVGVAIGNQERIDFSSARKSGLTTAFTAGLGKYLQTSGGFVYASEKVNQFTNLKQLNAGGNLLRGLGGALSSNVANKLEDGYSDFNWGGVAASAITSQVPTPQVSH